ncbi:DnaB-like helicase N-terminal domain-containing protein [Duganella vulcania]|uniref:DNA helicase DnaB-like N-terminal domain-containing protein n=1 Tax=Duganella vulcania TaxID=2692166 RepID=A0A845GI46_9BURK|nr:DnaB-like helicase N-terminal domain-containing protein [Duganella vulcania]MYM92728.1 hypothetical protein [Duganella vulcania]
MMAEKDTGFAELPANLSGLRGTIAGRLNSSCVVERAVLGAVFLHPSALRELERLRVSDFVEVAHQKIFGAMMGLHEAGCEVDAVSVALRLEASGDLVGIGGPAYLGVLSALCPAAGHVRLYVSQLLEQAGERQLSSVIEDLIAVRDAAGDWRQKCAAAMTVGVRLYGENLRRPGAALLQSSVGELARHAGLVRPVVAGDDPLICTGVAAVDGAFDRLPAGSLVCVAGSELALLSSFGLFIGESAGLRSENPVPTLFVTPSLPPAYLAAITLARASGVPLDRIRLGDLLADDDDLLGAARGRLESAQLHILGLVDQTLAGLKRLFLNHCAVHGCPRLVIIDRCALQLMTEPDFVAQLAAWSRDFGIVTVCLVDGNAVAEPLSPLSVASHYRLFEGHMVACLGQVEPGACTFTASRAPFVNFESMCLSFDSGSHRFKSVADSVSPALGGVHV